MAKLTVMTGETLPATGFEDFIRPHFDALYGRAHRLTGDTDDAEDLVQDFCVRVYPRLAEMQKLDNPRAWLFRVLYNLFIDQARSRQRSPLRSVSTMEEEGSSEVMACSAPGPEEHVESILAGDRLERALRYLDQEDRALLVLHGVEGHSLAELEGITGLPQGTLKSRLHRARVRLGRLMQREENLTNFAVSLRGSDDELPRHRESAG